MAGPQSRRKLKKSRWSNAEALNRRRGKSPAQVCPGIGSRNGKPLEKKIVLKLEELCRAVLDVRSLKRDGAKTDYMTGSGTSHIKQDLKECFLPVVETSRVGIEESEMTRSEVYGVPASSRGSESDDANRTHSFIKIEISEMNNWKEQEKNLIVDNADLYNVKTECELDVNSVISDTKGCKKETVDHLVDVDHKVEQKDVEHVEDNNSAVAQAVTDDAEEQEDLSDQSYPNKTFLDASRAAYRYCKERESIYTDPLNLAKQSGILFIASAAADEGVCDSVSVSGVGYSTDEDAGFGHVENQRLSGSRFWMRNRKCVSYSLSSSTEESLDSLVSSGMSVRESLPGSKSDHLKDDISYNMINCDVVIGSDRGELFYREIPDVWSTTSSPVSKCAPPLTPVELSVANSYRCVSRAQSWSPALLPVTSGVIFGGYLEPGTDPPLQYGSKASDSLAGSLHQDVRVFHSAVPTSYPAMCVSPAASVTQEGMGPENEPLKSQEGELFRRIEESLAERETLKYQEKELLKRIARSLTETKSLKCREEQLLNKIERSLTRAKSLKSQEEELLRRIEVSLAQRGTAKSQDEELLVRMETLKDTKFSFVDVDSVSSMELESENMPDLENSLPLKKRKKWLKTVTENEKKEIQVKNLPLESFPSFPLWPMISIAELEAVGKLQQHPSFPSFPSRPMISVAELEAHTAFGRLQQQQQPCHSPVAPSWVPRYPYYCEENRFYGKSFCSRNTVGRTYGECFEQSGEMTQNTMVLPVFKSEESAEHYSCCKTSSGCMVSQSGVCDMAYLQNVDAYSDGTALSVCSGVVEDSKADIHLFVGPAVDSVDSKVAVDSKVGVESCERTSGSSDLYMVDTDSKDVVDTQVSARGSECTKDNSEGSEVTLEVPECTKDDKIELIDAKNCTVVNEEIETPVESKCIKVEADSKDSLEHCGVLDPPLIDLKYKADVDFETSAAVSRFTKVDVESKDGIALQSCAVNSLEGPKYVVGKGLENNIELQGESDENLAYTTKAKDNAEWCRKIEVPVKESKFVADVGSKEGFL